MTKTEEEDLPILVTGLSSKIYNAFRRKLIANNSDQFKLKLLEVTRKNVDFNKNNFIKKNNLDAKRFNSTKFELFQDLIHHLKISEHQFSEINLFNELIELEILLENALYIKAKRKLNKIKKIAYEQCDFDLCCKIQRKAIEHRFFNYEKGENSFNEGIGELKEYISMAQNLNSYKVLSEQIAELHYQFLDKRVEDTIVLLNFNSHPLLQDVNDAKSVLAVYYYYRAKSLIHLGNNDFHEVKKYSMLAYRHLNENKSVYRDDFVLKFKALNNYLDSSMNLTETEPFERIHPIIEDLIKKSKHKFSSFNDAFITQANNCLVLNYLWIKKDFTRFSEIVDHILITYKDHKTMISPNFRIEILLCIARMYFINGDLKEANYYCKILTDEKTNPTSLIMSCGNILRVMIQHDLGDFQLISHLISTSKYFLKNNERLFNLERTFLNGLQKIKPYLSDSEKYFLFKELHNKMKTKIEVTADSILDKKIGILDWIESKT